MLSDVVFPRRTMALVAAIAIGLQIAACGGDDSAEHAAAERQIRTAFADLRQNFDAGDIDAVCARMSASAKRHLGLIGHGTPTTCRRDLRGFYRMTRKSRRGEFPEPRIVAVELDGDRAAVRALLGERAITRLPFVREGDDWKIANFFGITKLPPKEG